MQYTARPICKSYVVPANNFLQEAVWPRPNPNPLTLWGDRGRQGQGQSRGPAACFGGISKKKTVSTNQTSVLQEVIQDTYTTV